MDYGSVFQLHAAYNISIPHRKLMSHDPLQGHSEVQGGDATTTTSSAPNQSPSAVPPGTIRPLVLKESHLLSGKRIGRQCARCRVYFVAERIDEMKCNWCVKIDAGVTNPVVIDSDQSIATVP